MRTSTAIITGAASGIGRATAVEFANAGYRVLCADLDAQGALAVAADLNRVHPGSAHAATVDVRDRAAVVDMVQAGLNVLDQIDALVHCAGITMGGQFLDLALADWNRIVDTNLHGSFHVCQAVARAMAPRGRGAIVTIGSVTGQRATSGRSAYATAKGGLVMLTRSMAIDLAAIGVRANCVAPGCVETALTASQHSGDASFIRDAWQAQAPMQRYAQPDEIARAALFLCSDSASFITGHVLDVDGGFMAAGMLRPARSPLTP